MLSGIDLGQDHLKNESLDDLPNVKKQHANIYLQMIKIFVKIMSLSHGLAETGK